MSEDREISDCIDDKMKDFKPVGKTPKERSDFVRNAFKKAAEDCVKKIYGS
jgi:hypothetical protein